MNKTIVSMAISILMLLALAWVVPTSVKAEVTAEEEKAAIAAHKAAEKEMASQYSAEEKAAVKAWLSAHGYSPTMAGAQQAYNDYLNGMWGGPGKDPRDADNNQNNDNGSNDNGGADTSADASTDTAAVEQPATEQPEVSGETPAETPVTKTEPAPLSPEAEKVMVSIFKDVEEAEEEANEEKVLKSEYDELEAQVGDKDQQIEELLAKQEELEKEQERLEQEKAQQELERQKAEEEVAKTRELVAKRQKQAVIAAVMVLVICIIGAFIYIKKKKK